MIYFDTTYIIKCYLAESGTAEVLALAQSHPGRACALHGRIEFFSAVKRHVREAILPRARRTRCSTNSCRTRRHLWSFLPISRSLVESACTRLAALPETVPCRAADALHLTCAALDGFNGIYSNDRHLLTAAPHFGLEGQNVIS